MPVPYSNLFNIIKSKYAFNTGITLTGQLLNIHRIITNLGIYENLNKEALHFYHLLNETYKKLFTYEYNCPIIRKNR